MEKLLILVGIHFLALASPGPDFIVVLRSSLSGKINKTLMCCIGIALGVATHLLMVYIGLSIILSQSKILYSIVVVLGCLWLIKMGVLGIKSNGSEFGAQTAINYSNGLTAFRDGYLTNLLNPKALVYFVSVISPLIRPGEDNALFSMVGVIFTCMTFAWFAFLALSLNTRSIKKVFEKYSIYIDHFFSVIILILALYILYTELVKVFI